MRFATFFCLALLLTTCHQPDAEKLRWENHASQTTIIRDDFGVPHIYGKTDTDAVFGLLYAQCEDDFQRIERNYITAIGRLAEIEGEKALYNDLRANLFMTQEEAIQQYEDSPDWLKNLCLAFADGINFYLFTHPKVKPDLLTHFEPWMPMYFSEGSIGGDIESISTDKIKAFYEGKRLSFIDQTQDVPLFLEEPQGSNGIAISGNLTESGHAMLLINPHTTFYFRGEVHVVSEEGLNAYGAVTWGQFFVYQGFNDHNGWMHTSSQTDVMDEFVETIIEKEGKRHYRYGDDLRPMEEKTVSLKFLDSLSLKERKFPVYRTHHGPITHQIGEQWVSTAMMWDPAKALEQAFIRTKTKNYQAFRQMMNIRTNSSNNTVYADQDGNIAYFQGNFIPIRDVQFDYSKPVDGSLVASDWKGLHTVDESIHLLNPDNGWIQNCNSTPFTAALQYSPHKNNYPYYMAPEPENFRGLHAVKVLTGKKNFTLEKLIETAYDPFLPAFEVLIPGLIEAYDQIGKGYDSLKPAIEILRSWDYRVSKESVGMSLAHYYGTLYHQKKPRIGGQSTLARFTSFGHETPYEERISIFVETLQKLKEDFGEWNKPWGEINRFQRLSNSIIPQFDDNQPSLPVGMASGNWGALASFGARGDTGTKRIYGMHGNSFVAVVEFGEKVRAKSLLAGGQSGDTGSKHFFDQGQRYADGQFKDVAYYRDDVEVRAERIYHPGDQ